MKTALKMALVAAISFTLVPAAQAATYEEELAQLRSTFTAADKNEDGKLTKQEASDGGMRRLANFFGRVDTDSDGFVTLPQLEARLAQRHGK